MVANLCFLHQFGSKFCDNVGRRNTAHSANSLSLTLNLALTLMTSELHRNLSANNFVFLSLPTAVFVILNLL